MGGRTRGAADLPQSALQRDQVHAAGRRNLAEGRLDRVGGPIHERQGYRTGHSGRGNPGGAGLVRAGLELDQIGRARRWPRSADRQESHRPARRHVHAQVQAAHRHRSGGDVSAGAGNVSVGADARWRAANRAARGHVVRVVLVVGRRIDQPRPPRVVWDLSMTRKSDRRSSNKTVLT